MKIIFFDVETETIQEDEKSMYQGFRLCYAQLMEYRPDMGWRKLHSQGFYSIEEFHDWFDSCIKSKQIMYVISANIWFDLRNSGLFFHLVDSGLEPEIFFTKGTTTIIKLKGKYKTVVCLNMQQFVPGSVKKYGEIVGLPKLDVDLKTTDLKELMTYCGRDTQIIAKVFEHWIDYIEDNELGQFRYTLAGQAFTAYRYRFMHKDIYIHCNTVITELERASYTGGRVEMFHQGEINGQKLYKLDINSMYPYIMSTVNMPVRFIGTDYLPSAMKLFYYLTRYNCIARVALNTDIPAYPTRHNDRLVFPTGKFVTTLADPELRYAYENNHIAEIEYLAYYQEDNIFRDYIAYFYNLRAEYKHSGNTVFNYITKLLMNSLYGKFGQKIDTLVMEDYVDESKYENNYVIDMETGSRFRELILGHKRKVFKEGAAESIHSFVAIPSTITSSARLMLWRLISRAGGRNCYYCDTDSLFVNQQGYDNLADELDDKELGKLKLEKVTDRLVMRGPKDYVFGEEEVIKGIRKDAKRNKDGSYSQLQFPGFKADLKHGFDKPYRIVKMTKHLKRVYMKGTVTDSGAIVPYHLQEF